MPFISLNIKTQKPDELEEQKRENDDKTSGKNVEKVSIFLSEHSNNTKWMKKKLSAINLTLKKARRRQSERKQDFEWSKKDRKSRMKNIAKKSGRLRLGQIPVEIDIVVRSKFWQVFVRVRGRACGCVCVCGCARWRERACVSVAPSKKTVCFVFLRRVHDRWMEWKEEWKGSPQSRLPLSLSLSLSLALSLSLFLFLSPTRPLSPCSRSTRITDVEGRDDEKGGGRERRERERERF